MFLAKTQRQTLHSLHSAQRLHSFTPFIQKTSLSSLLHSLHSKNFTLFTTSLSSLKKIEPSIHTHNQQFRKLLAELNPAQAAAVNALEGPVLVLAGPGTGKTHVLAARIGKILLETDTEPHNILCLTFTDAGTHAMRERLLSFIGPAAHRVHIHTFHSFCNSVIRENAELFGVADLESLSDLERVDMIRTILDALPPGHALRNSRTSNYFYEKHLENTFKVMKAENFKVEDVEKAVKMYLDGLPNKEEFVYKKNTTKNLKGEVKLHLIEDEKQKMEKLLAAVQLFPKFEEAMKLANRYDFEDMILWVLRIFETNENVLRNYQERFLYTLVDEYQDTNGSQNALLNKLMEFWEESPNLFVVGDDDQGIYEFQGARLRNILDFVERYQENLQVIPLTENFRSSTEILQAASTLIGKNHLRLIHQAQGLTLHKTLRRAAGLPEAVGEGPSIQILPSKLQEELFILQKMEELRTKGASFGQMAVLYRNHKQSARLQEMLRQAKIPFVTKRPSDALLDAEVVNLRRMLEYIVMEQREAFSGNGTLYDLLHHSFWGLKSIDLARLQAHIILANKTASAAESEHIKARSWREYIADSAFLAEANVSEIGQRILADISKLLEESIDESSSLGPVTLAERLLNRSGLLSSVLVSEAKTDKIQSLFAFFEWMKSQLARNPLFSLEQLLTQLGRMTENKLRIPIHKQTYSEDGVTLSTAHSAKGLEFDHVFMLDCTKNGWLPSDNKRGSFSWPDTLTFSRGEEDSTEASRRLFFVAMTRARKSLWMTSAEHGDDSKALSRSIFSDEVYESGVVPRNNTQLPDNVVLEAQISLLTEPERPTLERHLDNATLANLLQNFALSATSLGRYLDCPLSFYYLDVMRIPVGISIGSIYGQSAHGAMQRLTQLIHRLPEEAPLPESKVLSGFFATELTKRRGQLTSEQYEQLLAEGQHWLPIFYAQRAAEWPRHGVSEKYIHGLEWEGVPLKGTLDRIGYMPNGTVVLTDFKTGKADPQKAQPISEKYPHGGDFWRQMQFYKILYDLQRPAPAPMKSARLEYLSPEKDGRFEVVNISFTADGLLQTKSMITQTWAKIQAYDFFTGCGKKECRWCNFVNKIQKPDSLADIAGELLDD